MATIETTHLTPDGPVRREEYERAQPFDEYLAGVVKNRELWHDVHRMARIPPDISHRARMVAGNWRLLALSEDWCGDAVNTLPVVARLAVQLPALELRVLGRDANPALMDAHLSRGARAIPVVMALDEGYVERGWWGSRPQALQEWLVAEGFALPKETRYPKVREWYARDGARSTLEAIVALLERAAGSVAAPAAVSEELVR